MRGKQTNGVDKLSKLYFLRHYTDLHPLTQITSFYRYMTQTLRLSISVNFIG